MSLPLSTSCIRSGVRLLSAIYRFTCDLLSPASKATLSEAHKFGPTWAELFFDGLPAFLFTASNFIWYAFAFSLGRICSRWQLESTIKIMAVSSSMSRTIQGMVSTPARWLAWQRRCPATISYPPSRRGRTMAGVITPYSLTLSTILSISSSSRT